MNLLMNTIYVFKNIVMFLNDNKCEIRASQVAVVKNLPANARDARDVGLILGSGRSPRELTPVFFPGKSHGQRSLAGDSPWGHRVRYD